MKKKGKEKEDKKAKEEKKPADPRKRSREKTFGRISKKIRKRR